MAHVDPATAAPGRPDGRFAPELMFEAARQYYEDEATQAQIADRLGVSRPTVSRLLAEARRTGMVEITLHPPDGVEAPATLATQVAERLRVRRVRVIPGAVGDEPGRVLAPGIAEALVGAGLVAGDTLLVSSGLTLYQLSQQSLPRLPGVMIAPTVGGQEEPEPWYQTNVIATLLAERIHGTVAYLNAPALPTAATHRALAADASYQRVTAMWGSAKCALVGVGADLAARTVIPSFVPASGGSLDRAVGDICSRFYDASGRPVKYPGSARLVAVTLEQLQQIPVVIAAAAGSEKVAAVAAGARAGYFNELVTDRPTAELLASA